MQNQSENAIPSAINDQNDSTRLAEIEISLRRILKMLDAPTISDAAAALIQYEAERALEAADNFSIPACV
jgi:hypothetical protein